MIDPRDVQLDIWDSCVPPAAMNTLPDITMKLTHRPTGIVVEGNTRETAMLRSLLRRKLWAELEEKVAGHEWAKKNATE